MNHQKSRIPYRANLLMTQVYTLDRVNKISRDYLMHRDIFKMICKDVIFKQEKTPDEYCRMMDEWTSIDDLINIDAFMQSIEYVETQILNRECNNL